jgi:hypothetical protein
MAGDNKAVEQVLRDAASAVEAAGLSADLRAVGFAKAIDLLVQATHLKGDSRPSGVHALATRAVVPVDQPGDEGAVFEALARESGISEQELRDILQMTPAGQIHVTAPTKDLGSSVAEQAKNVIALVAGARAMGLGERPVDAEAVRGELARKHCYQSNNFATFHLGAMKGFNAGSSRSEIVLTSKWAGEFASAVAKAHGRKVGEAG